MSGEEIKQECEAQYAAINIAKNRLMELRAVCTHEKKSRMDYEWRSGSIHPALVCDYCGECVKFILPIFSVTSNRKPYYGKERKWANGEDVVELPYYVEVAVNFSNYFRGQHEEYKVGQIFKVKTHGKTMTLDVSLPYQRFSYSNFNPAKNQ